MECERQIREGGTLLKTEEQKDNERKAVRVHPATINMF